MGWAEDVNSFWFSLAPEQWWRPSPGMDEQIKGLFGELWAQLRQCPVETFVGSPEEALAGAILFDQLPRNMFRGTADAFATDHLARAMSNAAIERGYDARIPVNRRMFLYMPFEHSENMADQERSLLLFTALGDADALHFAKRHYQLIRRFGRFPHRNATLGRAPRADELAAGDVVPG